MQGDKKTKVIWVKKNTHKIFKGLCVDEECNFDEMIIKLIKQYKIKK